MGLQTISSGAFSFQRTADNRTRTAIAGTMNISVDNNNDISGDFRVHDAETPGGLPTPPAGTLSYMLTEKAIFTEEFVATANNQAQFVANTTLYAPFETEDNVRVYINDQEIRPFYAAFTIDYAASLITITDSKFTDLIIQDETTVRLEWIDSSFNNGIKEKDGWHFCDGRTLLKSNYSALYNSIGDLWNSMITPKEMLASGFNHTLYHPFNDVRKYEGNGLFLTYDVDFDVAVPDNIIVYRRTPAEVQADTWENAELLVEGTHYTKASDGKSITFERNHMLESRWEIFILGKKETDEFQIPDLRGYYLRAIGADTNRNPDTSDRFGIDSLQGDSVKKHSHFMITESAGKHQHEYVPWFWYGGFDPEFSGGDPVIADLTNNYANNPTTQPDYDYNVSNTDMVQAELDMNKGKMPGTGNVQEQWNDLKAVRRGTYYHVWGHYSWNIDRQNPNFASQADSFYALGTATTAPDFQFTWANGSYPGASYIAQQVYPSMYNDIEPQYFLLGAGPSAPIDNEQKYHYHEIYFGDPDASGPATTEDLNFDSQDEVDMFHIKLPIFIKY